MTMSKTNDPMRPIDEIVEEVRAIRRRQWQQAGNDVGRFLQQLEQDVPWSTIKNRQTRRPAKPEHA